MRYLSLLAAILASTPICAAEITCQTAAEFTCKIVLPPGFAVQWQAPKLFTKLEIGNRHIVDVLVENKVLTIVAKPKPNETEVGTTNILLTDEDGEQVANVLVINTAIHNQLARSAKTGAWQFYRKDDECYPLCIGKSKEDQKSDDDIDDSKERSTNQ